MPWCNPTRWSPSAASLPRKEAHRLPRSSSTKPTTKLRAQAEENRQATQRLADQQQRQAEATRTIGSCDGVYASRFLLCG